MFRNVLLSNVIFLTILYITTSQGRPVQSGQDKKTEGAMAYLMQYGYLDEDVWDSIRKFGWNSQEVSPSSKFRESVKEFQSFAGLRQTGVLDSETERMMSMPRCGVKDVERSTKDAGERRRGKRFVLEGSDWSKKDLTYNIHSYPTSSPIGRSDVDSGIAEAMSLWSQAADLTFAQKSYGSIDIEIQFVRGEHGDGKDFEGTGGVLAHATYPKNGGDVHFDDEEIWTKGSTAGTTHLLYIATHELGHALGLMHSKVNDSIMRSFYLPGFNPVVTLHEDDIKGIQSMYGKKSRTPENTLCRDASLDAIVTTSDNSTFVFKGKSYWKLVGTSIAKGYPRSISQDWGGLPSDLDTAFVWASGKTYFFKGSKYWRFAGQVMDPGYPKEIRVGFEGIPNDVDAAFVLSGSKRIYFLKDSKYYKYDPERKPPVSTSYPKPISNWEGIPDRIDDALTYSNGNTYFFKGGQYWRFDDTKFKVDRSQHDYPRAVGKLWFGCAST